MDERNVYNDGEHECANMNGDVSNVRFPLYNITWSYANAVSIFFKFSIVIISASIIND